MKKLVLTTLISIIAISFSGCATYIRVSVQKPSEINIGNVKKISINNFSVSSNVRTGQANSLGAMATQALVDYAFEKLGSKNNHSERRYDGNIVSDRLYNKLIGSNYFKLIKRDNQYNTLDEKNSVDASLTGFVDYNVIDSVELVDDIREQNGVTIRNKKFSARRRVETRVSYQMIRLNDGRSLNSTTLSDSDSSLATGDTQDEAIRRLRDWYWMVDEHLNNITERIVRQITPYYIYQDLEIKDGKSKNMKNGLEYAKRYLWENAKKEWDTVIIDPKSDMEDIIFANYNIGIYNEVNGNFDLAADIFDECFKKSGKSECIDAKYRVEGKKRDTKILAENSK
ncbi:MAG: hypothetical protein H7263_15430 [Candidatus Sericytochromatia bacterium]|nr:hypothetical protein [Candidatus Sericytochromatia bacterium]